MAHDVTQQYEQRLRIHPRLLASVRRIVDAKLRHWGHEALITPAAICVTELLSNVDKHVASPECVLTLQNNPDGIRAVVSDTEPALPIVKEPDYLSESGRGMFLLSKTAHEWGATPTPNGKEVWFTLRAEEIRP